MLEPKRPLCIFLCYASTDGDAVGALYTRLIRDGLDVWLDKEKLLPGQDRELEIRKAVRAADVVIICLSNGFNQAGYQQKEVRIALDEAEMQPEGTIFIIPSRLEECDIPASLKRWHWVDLFEVDAYKKMMLALQARALNIGTELKTIESGVCKIKTPVTKRQTKPTPNQKKMSRENKSGTKRPFSLFGKKSPKLINKPKIKSSGRKKLKPEIIIALIGAVSAIMVAFLDSPMAEQWLAVRPAPTPAVLLTEAIASPASSHPIEIMDTDCSGNSIPMRLVPAGEFQMGSYYGINDGNLVHNVKLDAFYMDVYEVTNVLYKACVSAGACHLPQNTSSYTRKNYFINASFDNYPVVNVSWHMAESYCKWRGAQLPTEAQWEKAARGGLHGKSYPWGDTTPVCKRLADNGAKFDDNFECNATDTDAVGSYSPNGFGLYDMAGNVWEWTGSLYRHYPYDLDDGRENLEEYGARVLRGGSWFNSMYLQRVSFRNKGYPDTISYLIGFRCARDANP